MPWPLIPALLLLAILVADGVPLSAQTVVNLLGNSTPTVIDGGNSAPVLLGVKMFSDVPGQVLGCSFYKSPGNIGVHVVMLWDSAGKLLATQQATAETASGKQSVRFSSPVPIAAKQTFTCGYFAPYGHNSFDSAAFAQPKDVPPLHAPINAGVYTYGPQSTTMPTSFCCLSSSYWVDVLFAPSTGSTTWISGVNVSPSGGSGASVSWNTAVPSDSQVEYGPTNAYGSTTSLAPTAVTAHAVSLSGLVPGTAYHLRVRSRDSDTVTAVGVDYTFAVAAPVMVALTPGNATISSNSTQQFVATVSNTVNTSVTWSATAGSVDSSGLFTAPSVASQTSVMLTASSQVDPSKNASSTVTIMPLVPVLAVSPTSLSFSGQAGTSTLAPASVSITNTGAGKLTFTGVSDQPWLVLAGASGTAPSTLQVSPSMAGLKAGTYTGHVTLTGGGTTKSVTVALEITSPPVQHTVSLSWKASTNTHVVSYSLYRSSIAGGSYGLLASAIGGVNYIDQAAQSGATYYYVVTAVDDQGRESAYSNQAVMTLP